MLQVHTERIAEMSTELYLKYRPTRLADVIGQDDAVKTLLAMHKHKRVPHALLFTGPSGCGKTTMIRIMANKLGCGKADYAEENCANDRGIKFVRDIHQRIGLAPMSGTCRVWGFDECHKLTTDAQTALLKMLEDTPKHVYFMLATTDPGKLLKTIQTRCTEIRVKYLESEALEELLQDVAEQEEVEVSSDVIARIIEVCDGSARKALVILGQVIKIEDEEDQLNAILSSDAKRQAIELCRALVKPKAKWQDITPILKSIEDEPESIRYLVLAYATTILLSGGPLSPRAYLIINAFRDNFFDSKKAGLVAACWEVINRV